MTALADLMADTTAWVGPPGTGHRRPVGQVMFCGQTVRDPKPRMVDRLARARLCPACWPERASVGSHRGRVGGKAGA